MVHPHLLQRWDLTYCSPLTYTPGHCLPLSLSPHFFFTCSLLLFFFCSRKTSRLRFVQMYHLTPAARTMCPFPDTPSHLASRNFSTLEMYAGSLDASAASAAEALTLTRNTLTDIALISFCTFAEVQQRLVDWANRQGGQ